MNSWSTIIITLLLSAFFSGMEIAFISSNKLKIELDKSKGLFSAKLLSRFNKTPSRFITTLLLGNNIALVIYGIVMANILKPYIINFLPSTLCSDFMILLIQTILATLLILIAAEFIPKVLFRINPNATITLFAVPVNIFYYLFYPIIYLFVGLSKFILKYIFRVKSIEEQYVFSPIDLDNYVKEFSIYKQDKSDIKQEMQIFQNAIDFKNVKLRECMVPRTEIFALDQNNSIETLKQSFIESGHSKILIFKDSIDNLIGYTHAFDMFKKPVSIKSILKPVIIFPETMLANNALSKFIKQNKSIAVVVDEFGGTSGIITMEDVIEEIFGEINDEYDVGVLIEKQINENEFIFSARLEIDYLNKKYNLNLPESDQYETLAGLIIHYHESIPKLNDKIRIDTFIFKILEASKTRIEKVNLKKINEINR